ncbi:hypothetical protein SDRG_10944 [Saprolegnia diclina VS20]|uniref:AV ZBD domain-containing protein n=1 Tax=Saprolegnia diclina (strain VS20) TaxID=1156394 RepID=T0RN02_SAPDV|nr:hypothetical protein SDRG_10944 [Saprolegnia diclina VS20]EQC31342.1 hypothetical protein SDRG_10944 [Saprolegnia diclina VS20]|eukprot:XP_008615183.1 hypothetical protein SDRG_10944 [Saprolegnia diclina VS20]
MDEVCGGCGVALPSNCRFCMHCGAPHHTKSFCACGHDITNMKFCAGCGEPTRATPARSGPAYAAPPVAKGLDMASIAESIRREQEEKGNLRLKAQELAAKKRAAAEARFAQAYGSVPHPTASPASAPRASTYVPPPPPTTYSRPTTAASTYARPKSAPMSQPTPSSAHAYRPVPAQSSPNSFRPHVSPPRSSPLPSSFPVQHVLPPATTTMTTHNKINGGSLFPAAASIATSMAPPVLPAASSSTASSNQRFGPQGFVPPRFIPPEDGQNHVYSVTQTVTRSVTYTQ